MLATAIKKSGYAVDEANDGPVAIEKIRKRPYHLVITDLRLPNLSGLEVLRAQREVDATIPVLIMTASARLNSRRAIMMALILTKPWISHLSLIERALQHRILQLENTLKEAQNVMDSKKHRQLRSSAGSDIQRVAPTDATVLDWRKWNWQEDAGIHQLNPRWDKPYSNPTAPRFPTL